MVLLLLFGVLIGGDFNFKIKWNLEGEVAIPIEMNNDEERKFVQTLNDCFFSQFIHFPTFQTAPRTYTDT